MLDANLDFLTWASEDLPSHHSSVKLRPLTQALFTRILPLGVIQMVTGPTRAERGVPATGLEHLYSNRPIKLSEVTTEWTGMSDHKIILARKFSNDFKRTERYTRKRVFSNFNKDQFREDVSKMSEQPVCLTSTSAVTAAALLNKGISRVLDAMAPLCSIQNRKSYVAYLTPDTKKLQAATKASQVKAVESEKQEDWRLYRSIRYQKNRAVKGDQMTWQKDKLRSTNNPSDMWKAAKSMLGYACSGPPTQLYHMGQYVNSPSGLATTMNQFFVEKVRKIREIIQITDYDPLSKMRERMRERTCTFSFNQVTVQHVQSIISDLRGSKAT